MSQIKQLLRLHQEGKFKKEIARALGISKNTVKTYLEKLHSSGWQINDLLQKEDPELESLFHSGNPAYSQERFDLIKNNLDHYVEELKQLGVTKKLLWEEYKQANPDGYGYSQFCFHLSQHLLAKNPTMVLEHKPGEKLFIDFAGKTISYINADTGEGINCQVFVATLPYSGHSFIMAVHSQKLEDFIHALCAALKFFGGVPQILVPDNLKSAIVKASKYEPEVTRALEDLANHYGCIVIPARVRKPQDKALVENRVGLNYTQVYARLRKQQFFSLQDLNEAMWQQNNLFNQTRMQQKTYSREEKFIAEEKPVLKPLPDQEFQIKHYKNYKVAKNNHIYLGEDNHYYSVPYTYIGQQVKVIYTRSMVFIYCKGERIAVHQRTLKGRGYTTVKEHLCSHHRHYLDRSPEYYIQKAGDISQNMRTLFERMFAQGKHPEQLYRSCDGLLSFARKTEVERINKACDIALEHRNYSFKFIENIITNKMEGNQLQHPQKPLPAHKNIRGKEHYEKQLNLKFK